MQVTHSLGILSANKDVKENVGFLLANKKGGYCSFFNEPASRYHGFFYFDEAREEMYRFIENIEFADNSVLSLKNCFYFVERKKSSAKEYFLMPKNFSTLVYELDNENEINLVLDCKKSYDNREFGRFYEISEENGMIIVKFTKKTDKREDLSDGKEEFALYLAIKSNSHSYEKNGRWIERHYSHDESRNSMPFRRHVYNALKLKGSKFVFSVSKNKADAVKECEYAFNNANELKIREKQHFLGILSDNSIKKILNNKKINNEIKLAYVNALNSLNNLAVQNKKTEIFAGMPWFFQFWARDTLISLKALSKVSKKISDDVLFGYLDKIESDGRLCKMADAHGWLFLRCSEIAERISLNKEAINSIKSSIMAVTQIKAAESPRIKDYIRKCNLTIQKKEDECRKVLYEIESSLEKSLNSLSKFRTKSGLEFNGPKETWMDTSYGNDDRKGVRIEVQALRLNMYRLMFELSHNHKYRILENTLKMLVRQKFWNGKILADGLDDFTVRPNIFIAAYAYPELLAQKEWEICFDNALKSLWLEWSGLSTIDKNNPLFSETSTGENPKSYHRGDSWFWINNLAALTLNKTNNKKFNKNIKKIISASTEEILWKGCVGCHSEISDAKELSSKGCFSQAWSNAMYVEMVDEVFN